MLNKYAITQTFKIKSSSLLIKCLVVLHVMAVFAAIFNTLELSYKIIIIALVIISLWRYVKREVAAKAFSIRFSSISGWEVAMLDDSFDAIEILPTTVITPYLIVLNFKMPDKQKHIVLIVKDALTDNEYRQLKVQLRISGLQKE